MAKTKIFKEKEMSVLISLPVISVILSLLFQTNFLVSTLLFFGLPALWLSATCRPAIKKGLIFTALLAIPVSILVDYIGVKNESWYVAKSVFDQRLFGVIPYEDLIWGFLLVYNPIMFYEKFFHRNKKRKSSIHRLSVMTFMFSSLLLLLALAVKFNPSLIVQDYAYLWMGIALLVIPVVVFLCIYPRFIRSFALTGSYFFLLGLAFELTSLELSHWTFPGESNDFVGWVTILGKTMPFEEFFFWFVVQASSTLTYYLVFDNDPNKFA